MKNLSEDNKDGIFGIGIGAGLLLAMTSAGCALAASLALLADDLVDYSKPQKLEVGVLDLTCMDEFNGVSSVTRVDHTVGIREIGYDMYSGGHMGEYELVYSDRNGDRNGQVIKKSCPGGLIASLVHRP